MDSESLVQNAGQYYDEQKKIELRGQIVELVESADYSKLGEWADANADVVLTVESFLLNVGEPLPASTLKQLHKAFTKGAIYEESAGTVLKDRAKDLDLVLVRWTAPPDIPQRENLMADPYPVTPGTEVTVQGVLTSGSPETWKHCKTFKEPYFNRAPCSNMTDVSGLRMEATRVEDVDSARFGFASAPLGEVNQ